MLSAFYMLCVGLDIFPTSGKFYNLYFVFH